MCVRVAAAAGRTRDRRQPTADVGGHFRAVAHAPASVTCQNLHQHHPSHLTADLPSRVTLSSVRETWLLSAAPLCSETPSKISAASAGVITTEHLPNRPRWRRWLGPTLFSLDTTNARGRGEFQNCVRPGRCLSLLHCDILSTTSRLSPLYHHRDTPFAALVVAGLCASPSTCTSPSFPSRTSFMAALGKNTSNVFFLPNALYLLIWLVRSYCHSYEVSAFDSLLLCRCLSWWEDGKVAACSKVWRNPMTQP
jgi:hypothetical protein